MKNSIMINKKKGVRVLVPDHRVSMMEAKGYTVEKPEQNISAPVKKREVKNEK